MLKIPSHNTYTILLATTETHTIQRGAEDGLAEVHTCSTIQNANVQLSRQARKWANGLERLSGRKVGRYACR